jgi:heme-degrading monooxygenase HmoA
MRPAPRQAQDGARKEVVDVFARVSTFTGPASEGDDPAKEIRDVVLPRARQMPGFKGLLSLYDRGSGKSIGITLWESEDAMRASEEAADRIRSETAGAGGQQIVSVERFEVVFDARDPSARPETLAGA